MSPAQGPATGPVTDEPPVRAADGRVPGRRGRATRRKLLDATAAMLETTSYRELKVVDIARRAGTSPATFYQYFPDVEAAIERIARQTAEDAVALTGPLDEPWDGPSGRERAAELVDAFLAFWDDHRAVLRVVDLAIAEGDQRFRLIRNQMLQPVIVRLAELIARSRGGGPAVEADAQAAVLVSMLAHVAEHRHGLEAWGVRTPAARDSMAAIVHWGVTGRSS